MTSPEQLSGKLFCTIRRLPDDMRPGILERLPEVDSDRANCLLFELQSEMSINVAGPQMVESKRIFHVGGNPVTIRRANVEKGCDLDKNFKPYVVTVPSLITSNNSGGNGIPSKFVLVIVQHEGPHPMSQVL